MLHLLSPAHGWSNTRLSVVCYLVFSRFDCNWQPTSSSSSLALPSHPQNFPGTLVARVAHTLVLQPSYWPNHLTDTLQLSYPGVDHTKTLNQTRLDHLKVDERSRLFCSHFSTIFCLQLPKTSIKLSLALRSTLSSVLCSKTKIVGYVFLASSNLASSYKLWVDPHCRCVEA